MPSADVLRDDFATASGLTTRHAGITHFGGRRGIDFDGFNADGTPFHIASGPIKGDLRRQARVLGILQKNQIMEKLASDLLPPVGLFAMPDKMPNVKALPQAFAKMQQLLDDAAGKMISKMEGAGDRGQTVVAKIGESVDGVHSLLDEVEKGFSTDTNGPPA